MMQHVSKLTVKGQVTVPIEIRRLLGVGPHDKVAFVVDNGQVRLIPASSFTARTAGILRGRAPRLSIKEEEAAVEEAWAEEADPRRRA